MDNLGNKEIFAKNLLCYIERSGKTQKEIAEIVGVAPSTFNDWTKGKKYPRIDKIAALAKCFGVMKSDLIEEKIPNIDEVRKNNDTMTGIIIRMRKDHSFMSLVNDLNNFDEEKLTSIRNMVSAFSK